MTITSNEDSSGSVVVAMSCDNKTVLDPLEIQGEDNLENPSPETEGQSVRKNKFSDKSSLYANTTSKGDVLSEPAASSEGAKRKEDVQKVIQHLETRKKFKRREAMLTLRSVANQVEKISQRAVLLKLKIKRGRTKSCRLR